MLSIPYFTCIPGGAACGLKAEAVSNWNTLYWCCYYYHHCLLRHWQHNKINTITCKDWQAVHLQFWASAKVNFLKSLISIIKPTNFRLWPLVITILCCCFSRYKFTLYYHISQDLVYFTSNRLRVYLRVGNFNLLSLSLLVRFLILIGITNLVAHIWTFSRSLINSSLCGFHTEFAYSKWDLTKLIVKA